MTDQTEGNPERFSWLVQRGDRPALGRLQRAIYMLNASERRLKWRHQRSRTSVSRGRLLALMYISAAATVTATDLAREGQMNPASVTAMLEQLESDGIVTRRQDEHDRRVWWVSLTPRGRREVGSAMAGWSERFSDAFSSTSDADLLVASQVIERLAETLEMVDPL